MIQILTVAAMLHLVLPELTDIQTYTQTHILLSMHKIAFGLASIGRVPYFLDILAKKGYGSSPVKNIILCCCIYCFLLVAI